MNHFTRIFAVLAMVATTATGFAYNFEEGGIYYNINSDETSVTVTYQGGSWSAYPDEYTGAVVIPASVVHEGTTYAVTMIGQYAFKKCVGLTSVSIPNSVTQLSQYAFEECKGLTAITIPNSVTTIDDAAFRNCDGLKSVSIGSGVEAINRFAFTSCDALTSITIPNSVEKLGEGAFRSCSSLASVSIGSGVVEMGDELFFNNSALTTIKVASGNPVYDSRSNCNAIIETATNTLLFGCKGTSIPDGVTSIAADAFVNSGITSVTIPNSVTKIGSMAFWGCKDLTSVSLGNSLIKIGEEAFEDCTALKSITIPNSVTNVSKRAFHNCESMTSLSIGSSLSYIADQAFLGCSGLTSIKVASGNTTFDSRNNCNAIIKTATNTLILGCASSTIPNTVTTLGKEAFKYSKISSIIIPNSVTKIESYAFQHCTELKSIAIPNSVTTIGNYAFDGCSSMTSVSIGKGTTSISTYGPFVGCPLSSLTVDPENPVYDSRDNCNAIIQTATNTLLFGFKSTIIPNTVTTIANSAFQRCVDLTAITIPNSVTTILGWTFVECPNLTSVSIGSGVTKIDANSFDFNNTTANLKYVRVLGTTPPTLVSDAFSSPTFSEGTLYVPKGCLSTYKCWPWEKFNTMVESDFIKGDVNVDNEVNATDITALINHLLNVQAYPHFTTDVNNDNTVNVTDVTDIITQILGGK